MMTTVCKASGCDFESTQHYDVASHGYVAGPGHYQFEQLHRAPGARAARPQPTQHHRSTDRTARSGTGHRSPGSPSPARGSLMSQSSFRPTIRASCRSISIRDTNVP